MRTGTSSPFTSSCLPPVSSTTTGRLLEKPSAASCWQQSPPPASVAGAVVAAGAVPPAGAGGGEGACSSCLALPAEAQGASSRQESARRQRGRRMAGRSGRGMARWALVAGCRRSRRCNASAHGSGAASSSRASAACAVLGLPIPAHATSPWCPRPVYAQRIILHIALASARLSKLISRATRAWQGPGPASLAVNTCKSPGHCRWWAQPAQAAVH